MPNVTLRPRKKSEAINTCLKNLKTPTPDAMLAT